MSKIPITVRIGVTGHRVLSGEDLLNESVGKVLSLLITPSEVKSPLRAVRKRPERAVPDIFLRVG
jgi:hypothetical protein